MSENNKKYILITAALIVIGAALYFFYWMRTPQYTFTQIHEAVQQHDLTKFEKHVDLNSLYAHAYDDVVYYAFGRSQRGQSVFTGYRPKPEKRSCPDHDRADQALCGNGFDRRQCRRSQRYRRRCTSTGSCAQPENGRPAAG